MKRLYTGITIGLITFTFFLISQNNFNQNFNKNVNILKDSINREAIKKLNDETIRHLDQKVDDMEKYVEAGQKNLDLWLKALATFLSIIIAASIFNGLKSRDLAKEELIEIRRIKEEIKRGANDAEDRLKLVKEQLTQLENVAVNARKIEDEMTNKLNEFASKEDLILNESQKKILDQTISKTKDDLQKSGLDAFKNLYYAKSLKASDEKKWQEAIRLLNTYIDLDEDSYNAYYTRGKSYSFLAEEKKDIKLYNFALLDYNNAIRLNNIYPQPYNNRGVALFELGKIKEALVDFDEAIRIKPEYALAYSNRARVYEKLERLTDAEKDIAYAKELNLKNKK